MSLRLLGYAQGANNREHPLIFMAGGDQNFFRDINVTILFGSFFVFVFPSRVVGNLSKTAEDGDGKTIKLITEDKKRT